MLGKTNISTVEKGVIMSDIEDYSWNPVNIQGINETFIKVIYADNTLVAITKTGTVAYTRDGENWEYKPLELDNGDLFELTDIVYGNGRYVIVGCHTDQETYMHGLVFMTEDLIGYETITAAENEEYFNLPDASKHAKFLAVSTTGNNFIILYIVGKTNKGANGGYVSLYAAVTDMEKNTINNQAGSDIATPSATFGYFKDIAENTIFKSAKKTNGELIFYKRSYVNNLTTNTTYSDLCHVFGDGMGYSHINTALGNKRTDLYAIFECRDNLYYAANTKDLQYEVGRVVGSGDTGIVSTDTAYGFVDAVYFDKCEVFINSHEMLVVRPRESMADKDLNDMVEITYDFSMTSIVKAFNKLYVFGTGGNILVSSNESRNEDALSVRTMSALRALYDAKAYTDKKCAELAEVNMDDYVRKEDIQEIGDETIEAIWNEIFAESEGGEA